MCDTGAERPGQRNSVANRQYLHQFLPKCKHVSGGGAHRSGLAMQQCRTCSAAGSSTRSVLGPHTRSSAASTSGPGAPASQPGASCPVRRHALDCALYAFTHSGKNYMCSQIRPVLSQKKRAKGWSMRWRTWC